MKREHIPRRSRAVTGLALPLAGLLTFGLAACQPDLGDPVIRHADWDATPPPPDGGDVDAAVQTANLEDYLPECTPDYYPCPPYGTRRNMVLRNIHMTAANDEAWALADDDGDFSLATLRATGAKLLFIFFTAGW